MSGGAGNDTLYGGAGADVFEFAAGDGQDQIYASSADDILRLDSALWSGTLTDAEVLNQFGRVDGEDYLLGFGDDSVVLIGLGSATQSDLETLIEIA